MNYLVVKSLHIITVVTWFAGLFYMPRLFVYFAEAESKNAIEKKNPSRFRINYEKKYLYNFSFNFSRTWCR